ncbi:hypothetical protein GCM10020331_069790 [Ectobacillus funiculus]
MLNIGIVGTGWFSGVHAEILCRMEGVRIGAICGTNQAKAEAYAAQFDHAKGYGNAVEMLDGEKAGCGLYLCAPHSLMEKLRYS